tara:strand:- start:691 stop:1362 length:672 start_codon:yes stop_codon:yes gene_type:complete
MLSDEERARRMEIDGALYRVHPSSRHLRKVEESGSDAPPASLDDIAKSMVLGEEGYAGAQPVDLESELTGKDTNEVLLNVLLSAGGLGVGARLAKKLLNRINRAGMSWPSWATPKGGRKSLDVTHKAIDDLIPSTDKSSINSKLKTFFDKADYSLESVAMTGKGRNALIKHLESGKKGHPFIKRPDGTYFIQPKNLDIQKYTLDSRGNRILKDALRKFDKKAN